MSLQLKMIANYFIPSALFAVSITISSDSLRTLIQLALEDTRYAHILLVPAASTLMLWLRRAPQRRDRAAFAPVLSLSLAGLIVSGASLAIGDSDLRLAASTLGILLLGTSVAIQCFGIKLDRSTAFPLLLFLACVPAPGSIMDYVVSFLQHASAETTSILFRLAGTPFTRDGFVFSFDNVDVEVAKQCSGIRSAILTTLGSILAGQLFLHRGWTRAGFALLSLPVVILKNAARIAGITWLGLYVDPGFFTGELHRYSGLPFSLLSVGILLRIFWGLHRLEAKV